MATELREWRQTYNGEEYLASTSRSLIQLPFIDRAFSDPLMYWTNTAPYHDLSTMLDHSCNICIYQVQKTKCPTDASDSEPKLQQVGLARLITDYITFAYLTDVYVAPECQGRGLGKWLIKCVREVMLAMPQLRRTMLLTGHPKSVALYEQELDLSVHKTVDPEQGLVVMEGKPKAE